MEIKKFIENLKPTYDNAYGDNLGKDFYSPCLENCKQYKRMTGEFRSSVIFDWGTPFSRGFLVLLRCCSALR